MTSVTHMVVGVYLTQVFPDPALSLPAALVSHYVLDAVPHNDYVYTYIGEDWQYLHESPISKGLLLAGGILVGALALKTASPGIAVLAAFVGMSPDIVGSLLKRSGRTSNPLYRFHRWVHTRLDLGELFYNTFQKGAERVEYPRGSGEFKKNLKVIKGSLAAEGGWLLESLLEISLLLFIIRALS